MNSEFFVRTIGDNSDIFEEVLRRMVSKQDYEEAAITNRSPYIFNVFVDEMAVSTVYAGRCEKYFKHDVFSMVVGGRRCLGTRFDDRFMRLIMKTQAGDEAWINLSKVNLIFAVIHSTRNSDKVKLAKKILGECGVRYFERKHNKSIDANRAKEEIDELWATYVKDYGPVNQDFLPCLCVE